MGNLTSPPRADAAGTLLAEGKHAFRRGELPAAREAFQKLVELDGSDPQQWIHLALICQGLKDEPGEEAAIARALELDPLELVALILRAGLLERQGKRHQAARAHGAVATVAGQIGRASCRERV